MFLLKGRYGTVYFITLENAEWWGASLREDIEECRELLGDPAEECYVL